jgi:uncharacterized membrane protein
MFTIIGADHKEYGPSSADEIRDWVRQGRADAGTMVRADGGEWKTLAEFPEFADLVSGPAAAAPPTGPPSVEELIARDYHIDIIGCFTRSWETFRKNFWPLVGVSALVTIIAGIINEGISLLSKSQMDAMVQNFLNRHEFTTDGLGMVALTWLLTMTLQPLFMAGLYKYYLKHIRGEETDIADAFAGLTTMTLQLLLLGLVMGLLTLLGMALCVVPGLYLSVAWFFATPLVIDRKIGFWDAMMLSMRMINKHWFTVFALIFAVGLFGACGICALCIGIFVTLPIAYVALMYGYEDVFGRKAA